MADIKRMRRGRRQQIIDQAKRRVSRRTDGAMIESNLTREVASIVKAEIDPDTEAIRIARRWLDAETKQPGESDDAEEEEDSSQLRLFIDGDDYGYKAERLMRSSTGYIIESDRATLAFKMADHTRSKDNLGRVSIWEKRKAHELELMRKWVEQERAKGRSEAELTWGNCIREMGLLFEPKK
jgi:hypothetical protein